MARHEGRKEHEKPRLEHPRKVERRARGGETKAEEKREDEKEEEKKRHERKHGGKVPGKSEAHRPDRKRRAEGGGVEPFSAAGKVSVPSFERHHEGKGEGGAGADKDPD
jgi:hypothetical protein